MTGLTHFQVLDCSNQRQKEFITGNIEWYGHNQYGKLRIYNSPSYSDGFIEPVSFATGKAQGVVKSNEGKVFHVKLDYKDGGVAPGYQKDNKIYIEEYDEKGRLKKHLEGIAWGTPYFKGEKI